MKEMWGFVCWGWKNFQSWQKMFIFAMFLQGVGWTLGGEYGQYPVVLGIAIVFGYLFKWAVVDTVQNSWHKYKQHRNQLFSTIKESDER